MRADDVRDMLRGQPFKPFQIHVDDGTTRRVDHPDQVLVLRSRLILSVDDGDGFNDRAEHVALSHIVRMEEIEPRTSGSNGAP